MDDFEDYYSILEVSINSSREEIKRSYQSLALKFHPDKQDLQNDIDACHRFAKISQAWQVLSNDNLRKKFDAECRVRELHQHVNVNEELELSDMNLSEETNTYSRSCRCGGQYEIFMDDIQLKDCLIYCDTCSLCIKLLLRDVGASSVG